MAKGSGQADGRSRNRKPPKDDTANENSNPLAESRAFDILKKGIKTTGDLKKFLVGAAHDVFAKTVTVKEGNFAVSTANGIVRIKSFEQRISERERGMEPKEVAI